jgi:integrase
LVRYPSGGSFVKGCRPFKDAEVLAVLEELSRNRYAARDRALFVLGLRAGFRISELLSLKIGDIIQNGNCVEDVTVQRRHMKKKRESRSVPLHPEAQAALLIQIGELTKAGKANSDTFIFQSRRGENRPLSRVQAWAILRDAYAKLKLPGKLGTHGMRKTFAKKIYALLGNDLMKTKELMGHQEIETTVKYLEFDRQELRDAVLKQS